MVWSLVANGVSFVTSLAMSVVVARLLTPGEMGVFAIGMASMAVVQSFLQFGMWTFVIRERDLDPVLLGSALGVVLGQGALVTLALAIAAPLFGMFQRSSDVTHIMLIMAAVPLIGSFEQVTVALWMRDLQLRRVALLTWAKSGLQMTLTIACAFLGAGPFSLAYGYVAAAVLGALVSIPMLFRARGVRPNLVHWRRLLNFGGRWMVLGGVYSLNARLPDLIMGRSLGLHAVGLYSRASTSLDMLKRAGVDPLARVFLPVLAREDRESGAFQNRVLMLASMLTTLFWPMLAAIAILSEPIMLFVYGAQWAEAAPVLAILCLPLAIQLLTSGTGEILMIFDRVGTGARLELFRMLLILALLAVSVRHGLVAVAGARAVEAIIVTSVYLLAIRKIARISLRAAARAQASALLVTLASVAPLLLFEVSGLSPHAPFLHLAAGGTIFLISYVAALFLIRHSLSDQLARGRRDMINALRKRRPARWGEQP